MKSSLQVGLIGFGMIGKVHAYGYATLPYYAPKLTVAPKIVCVVTSSYATAQAARETVGCEKFDIDYRRITEDPDIDVVHICTPNARHFTALLSAIEHGKHVYCEKPVVSNVHEAKLIRDALDRRGVDGTPIYRGVTQTAFHMRGFPAIRRAKELIDAGRLGQILRYHVGYYHSSLLSPTAPFRWKHAEGGGVILDLASHAVDLVDYLIGLPRALVAQTTTATPRRPIRALNPGEKLSDVPSKPVVVEDSVTVMTRGLDRQSAAKTVPMLQSDELREYPDNAACSEKFRMPLAVADPDNGAAVTGVIEATKLASGAEDELRIDISGTRGALRFSLMDPHYLEFCDATVPPQVNGGGYGWLRIACGARYGDPNCDFPSPKSTAGWVRAHVASLASFYGALERGEQASPSIEQGLRVQDALFAIQKSAQTREWALL